MTSAGVVTIVRGRRGHLGRMAAGVAAQAHPPQSFVVVGMGETPAVDAATSVVTIPAGGRLPLAAARNAGARAADAELIVFLDVDCVPEPDVTATYLLAYRERGAGIFSGDCSYLPPRGWGGGLDFGAMREEGRPHPSRPFLGPGEVASSSRYDLAWTVSLAIDRASFECLGGFDEAFSGYGAEDTDFTVRARDAGIPLWRVGCLVHHQHHDSPIPPVHHLDDIIRNATLFRRKHGWWPMQGWLDDFEEMGLITRRGDRLLTI